MASSRESDSESSEADESAEDSESVSESENTFEPVFLIALLISLHRAAAEIILKFDMTSHANHWFVLIWLTENLSVLNNPDNSRLLLLLENIMKERDDKAEFVAERALSAMGFFPADKPIEERAFQRLLEAIRASDYLDEVRESRHAGNAAFFGNHKMLGLFLKNEFHMPEVSSKIGESFQMCLGRGDKSHAKNYLATLQIMLEYKLKNILNEVRDKIKTFKFVLHNGGGVMIDEIGHKVPAHAAKVFNIICDALKSEAQLIRKYVEITEKVCHELSVPENNDDSSSKEKGWFSTGWFPTHWLPTSGVRDSSTTACYNKIIKMLKEGANALKNYEESVKLGAKLTS